MQVCCKKQVLYPSKDNYIFLRNLLETTEYKILASFIPKGTYFFKMELGLTIITNLS